MTRIDHRLFAAALLLFAACVTLMRPSPAHAADEAVLARDGKALMTIRVGANASDRERAAANHLQDYLSRITGGHFDLQQGDGDSGIVVGTPDDFAGLPFDVTFGSDPLEREHYLLRSTANGVWLLGASDLAVEHAAWDLLYRLGWRQFFPGEKWEIVPHEATLKIAVDDAEKPDFHARRIWYNWGTTSYNRGPYAQWSARNRAVKGFDLNSGHAYDAIIGRHRQTFNEHPEYRGLVGGERKGNKFCISNPGLRELVVADAVAQFKRNPALESVSIDPSDGGGWCECEPCAAMGSVSDRALTLANAIAAEVNTLGLGAKYVGMYAYNQHSPPPSIDVHPNVIITATTAFIRGGYTLDQIVQGWQAKGATMGIYDYFTVIVWDWNRPRGARAANPFGVANSIKKYHSMGARFFDAESGDAWGPYGLGFYVASRCLWDLDEADRVDALVEDFLVKSFGPAQEPMRRFYDLITVDSQRRSSSDMLGRMYRDLAEAREKAQGHDDVLARIDDLIKYTRYFELYETYAGATGGAKEKAKQAVLEQSYRMRETMMIHSYGIWARMAKGGQNAFNSGNHPAASDEPITNEEIAGWLAHGVETYKPVELNFKTVEFSEKLVPATAALGLPDVEPGSWPTNPQDRHNYHVWVDKAPATIHLKVTVQKVWNNRPHEITLTSPEDVTGGILDQTDMVKPDGTTYDVRLKTEYAGLHTIRTRDGGDYTRIEWPKGMPVTVPSDLRTPGVSNQFRGPWTMYFYVPKGTKVVAGWAQRIANWAPRISGAMKDSAGNVMLDFSKLEDGWFQVDVPEGQDGKLWKFENTQGVRQLVTVPPYFARTAEDLLLPEEVVKADSE